MAVSKRLRYEILRRDNHTCRYCGESAPDVKLTIDHVVPVSLAAFPRWVRSARPNRSRRVRAQ